MRLKQRLTLLYLPLLNRSSYVWIVCGFFFVRHFGGAKLSITTNDDLLKYLLEDFNYISIAFILSASLSEYFQLFCLPLFGMGLFTVLRQCICTNIIRIWQDGRVQTTYTMGLFVCFNIKIKTWKCKWKWGLRNEEKKKRRKLLKINSPIILPLGVRIRVMCTEYIMFLFLLTIFFSAPFAIHPFHPSIPYIVVHYPFNYITGLCVEMNNCLLYSPLQ